MHFVENSLTMVSWNLNSVLHSHVTNFLPKQNIPVVPHLPHLPDLDPMQVQLPQAEHHPQEKMISTHCTVNTNYNLAGAGHSRIGL